MVFPLYLLFVVEVALPVGRADPVEALVGLNHQRGGAHKMLAALKVSFTGFFNSFNFKICTFLSGKKYF